MLSETKWGTRCYFSVHLPSLPLSLTAVVVFAFVLCWLPFHVGRYLISKSTEMGSPVMSVISQYCNLISFVLFYLSAAINPILYNIMSKKYRMAACKLFGLRNNPQRSTSVAKGESPPCWTESTASVWLSLPLTGISDLI